MAEPDPSTAAIVDDYMHISQALGHPVPAKNVRTTDGRCVTCRLAFKHPNPRVAVLLNIISSEEAAAIIAAAAPKLHRSLVVGRTTTDGRTSWSCGLPRSHSCVAAICKRLAEVTGYAVEQFETVQCVRYGASQEYRLHNDWFNPQEEGFDDKMQRGGQRLVSIFVYLQQPEAGGCTWFPLLGGGGGVAFAPVVGHGGMWYARAVVPRLYFCDILRMYNMTGDGEVDARVLHAGLPVVVGEKWGMNVWIRQRPVPLPCPPPPLSQSEGVGDEGG